MTLSRKADEPSGCSVARARYSRVGVARCLDFSRTYRSGSIKREDVGWTLFLAGPSLAGPVAVAPEEGRREERRREERSGVERPPASEAWPCTPAAWMYEVQAGRTASPYGPLRRITSSTSSTTGSSIRSTMESVYCYVLLLCTDRPRVRCGYRSRLRCAGGVLKQYQCYSRALCVPLRGSSGRSTAPRTW